MVCRDGLFICFSGAPHDIRRQSLLHCGVGWAVDTLNCGEDVRVRRYVMRVSARKGARDGSRGAPVTSSAAGSASGSAAAATV